MPTANRWPKTCSCGEAWALAEWSELPPIGRYSAGTDGWIEVRTCFCGRSLGIPVADVDGGAQPDVDVIAPVHTP